MLGRKFVETDNGSDQEPYIETDDEEDAACIYCNLLYSMST